MNMPALGSGPAFPFAATPGLFDEVDLGPLQLRNRMAVAPMTRVSATADGRATDRMRDYYGDFARGGFGLIITEGIYTDRTSSQGYLHQPGLTNKKQVEAWASVVDEVHAAEGKIVAQLMHAGALSQGNPHASGTAGPSAVRPKGLQMSFYRGKGSYPVPRAMELSDIDEVRDGFANAARNAQAAGFDGVEVHGANGYLLDQFLSEGINTRTDAYGGSVAGRARLLLETVKCVRAAVGPGFPVGVRVSQAKVNDYEHRWSGGIADARIIFGALGRSGVGYIHTTQFEAWRPAFADNGASLASLARTLGGLPVIANGALHEDGQAARMLDCGEADMIAIGRGALANPDWPNRIRHARRARMFDGAVLSPLADLANADAHEAAFAERP